MRAALYLRVSTLDQHPESQLHDLVQLAEQRGWEIVGRYIDHGISGTRPRRPGLDLMMADAARASSMSCWCGPVTAWRVPFGTFWRSSTN